MAPFVVLDDVHVSYPSPGPGLEAPRILRGVSLSVAEGECLALLGPTGAGKSTLCLCLNGLIPHLVDGTFRGGVHIAGHSTREWTPGELSQTVGLVFQDAESQFVSMTVEDEVAFGLESLGLPPDEIEGRLAEALEVMEVGGLRSRSPLELSGGQKQRVALAAVMAMRPRVLVLDEPTTNLDPVGKAALLRAVSRLRVAWGTTIVWVTQDVDWVPHLADRVAVLWEGQIALEGGLREVFDQGALLRRMGLRVPQVRELAARFGSTGLGGYAWLGVDEAAEALRGRLGG